MELNSEKQTFPNNNRVREILHNAFFPLFGDLGENLIPYIKEKTHSLIYHLSVDIKSEYHGFLSDEIYVINHIYNLFENKDFAKLIRKSVSKPKESNPQTAQNTETNSISGENPLIQYLKEQYDEERQNYKNLWNEHLKVSSELAETKRELEHLKQPSHE